MTNPQMESNEALPANSLETVTPLFGIETERAMLIQALIAEAVALLKTHNWRLATAESLTGGDVASTICSVAGASDFFQGGVVAYQNQIKERILKVDSERLEERGAVDPVVAQNMAQGVLDLFEAQVAVATTGVAGPGASAGKPAGTVYICVQTPDGDTVADFKFVGERNQVRQQTTVQALKLLVEMLKRSA